MQEIRVIGFVVMGEGEGVKRPLLGDPANNTEAGGGSGDIKSCERFG